MKTVGIKGLGPVTLEVYNPTGTIEATQPYAPRLSDLSGKMICELSNEMWEVERIFPAIRQLLQKRFPDAEIVPYTDLPAGATNIDVGDIADIVKKKGCQAVIVASSG